MYYPVLSPELELCLQSAGYKFCNLASFIRFQREIKSINNIFFKFMLMNNNQIFRNCFVIIYCHLIKVSPQINKCIIVDPNELSSHNTIYSMTGLCFIYFTLKKS